MSSNRVLAKNWGDGHWYWLVYSKNDMFIGKEHAIEEGCPCKQEK